MATLLIAIRPDALSEQQVASVQESAPDMRVAVTNDRQQIEELLSDLHIVLGMFPRDLISRAPNLGWFHQWGAGADWLLKHPEATDLGFVLTNSAGVHAVPISEHVFAYLLAFARGLPHAVRHQLDRAWHPLRQADLFELEGKTLVLVGAGRIGTRIATLASAFGMRVLVVRRNPERDVAGAASVHGTAELDEVLPEADFVVLTVPLTTETKGMIGAPQLSVMKESGYFINIGRGGTVDQDELVNALLAGDIAGAGLDVFEEEPLPADSPLWEMANVIVTAHYSGATPRYVERVLEIFLDNLARFRHGEEMRNVVDKRLGY